MRETRMGHKDSPRCGVSRDRVVWELSTTVGTQPEYDRVGYLRIDGTGSRGLQLPNRAAITSIRSTYARTVVAVSTLATGSIIGLIIWEVVRR